MRLSRHVAGGVVALAAAGCTHSDAFVSPASPVYGPFSSGPTVQISFNSDQDYWPAWTDDGRGILYAFVDGEGSAPPRHRCIGLLPAAGGSRIWQLCDNRAVRDDTVSSYSAYALSQDGKLLVVEAIVPANLPFEVQPKISLWLADTAKPYLRTTLLTLPQTVDGFGLTWIADLAWTGPSTFIALGQQLVTLGHGDNSLVRDSIFSDAGMVITGTIAGGTATLHTIAGTDSATSYSLAENGASVVFTRHHDLRLFKVPVGGGTPMPVPPQSTIPDTAAIIMGELAGVSCKGSTCVVASDGIFLTDAYTARCIGGVCEIFASFLPLSISTHGYLPMTLQSVSLVTGVAAVLASDSGPTSQVFASPRISPVSGDVVVQRGGVWGHLQTFATAGRGNGHLFLMKGIVQ